MPSLSPSLVECICDQCGKTYWRTPSKAARCPHSFCSRACFAEWRRLQPPKTDPETRFLSYVKVHPGSCWEWIGDTYTNGYGRFSVDGGQVPAHRWSYEHFVGPIPEGFEVDHVKARGCRLTTCVKPDHLEAVTKTENIRRSDAPNMITNRAQRCKRGHSYAEHSHYRNGVRVCCRTCENENQRARYERGRAGRRSG